MVEPRAIKEKGHVKVIPVPVPVPPPPIKPHTKRPDPKICPPIDKKLRDIASDAVDTLADKLETELSEATDRANVAADKAEKMADSMKRITEAEIDELLDDL